MTSKIPLSGEPVADWTTGDAELSPADYEKVVAGATAEAARSVQQRATTAAKVMIVDDEPINIKLVQKYLRDVGYRNFITTTDSTSCMHLLRREKPDVVLLDIVMPNVDGLEILGHMRADQRSRFLPVLILTACSDSRTKRKALELGATDFLTKPVDANHLVPRVRNAVLAKSHQDHLENYAQQLTREICQKTQELFRARKNSHKQHLASKAETATRALHHVGNTLHSVNIAANFLYQTLRDSQIPSLVEVANALEEHNADLGHFLAEDDRGKVALADIRELSETLRAERHTALHEVRNLMKHLEHIRAIVATQHQYTTSKSTVEPVSLTAVLADAEQLSGLSSGRLGIQVDREFCELSQVVSDEQKLLQIFVSLMKHAIRAIKSMPADFRGRIRLRTRQKDAQTVCVEVRDNGCGIHPGDLPRIFAQLVTTKGGGHGFGLHRCANLVSELGGSIHASSEGQNCGATFTVELPLNPAEQFENA